MTLAMAFFFTLAILGSKEHLLSMTQKLLQAILPTKSCQGSQLYWRSDY